MNENENAATIATDLAKDAAGDLLALLKLMFEEIMRLQDRVEQVEKKVDHGKPENSR